MAEKQLHRMRWAVRGALLLGVAVSVVANVLHAIDNPISQSIAAWPPLALLLTIELISRVPVGHPVLAIGRLTATFAIAGIAAWVSYWHMAGVIARYGETGPSPYLIPLSVDGMIVVASICLVELSGRIAAAEAGPPAAVAPEAARLAEAGPKRQTPPSDPDPLAGDQTAAQVVRQPQRTAQEIELLVRATKAAQPDLGQRRIATIVGTSPTNVGRILREMRAAELAQPDPAATGPAALVDAVHND